MAVNDFKAKVLRVNQIINSGSTSTSPLLVYGLGSATDASGSFTAAHFAGTGSDVWMFISGTQGGAGSAGSYGAVAFKGDVVVSGVMQLGEQPSAPATPASDKGVIYSVTGNLFFKNDGGAESNLLSSSVAGSNTQVQFNDSGLLGATSGFTFDKASGDVTMSGDLRVNGNEIKSSTGATAITLSGDSVTVAGDLTVNGTTTTINTQNLLVEDQTIVMGYGVAGVNRNGGIILSSGSSDPTNVSPDLVFGRVDVDTWGAGRMKTDNGVVTNMTGMNLTKLRALEVQVAGAVDGLNVQGTELVLSSSSTKGIQLKHGPLPNGIVAFSEHANKYITFNRDSIASPNRAVVSAGTGYDMQLTGSKIIIQGGPPGVPTIEVWTGGTTPNPFLQFISSSSTSSIESRSSNNLRVGSEFQTSISGSQVQIIGLLTGSNARFNQFTGSLTKLAGGGDYLIAGSNISLSTGSLGEVTISSTAGGGTPAGSNTQVQYNNDGVFGAKSTFVFATGSDRLSVTHVSASTLTASFISPGSPLVIRPQGDAVTAGSDVFFFVSGSATDLSVFHGAVTTSGSLRIKDGGANVAVILQPNGQISGSAALLAGGNITAGGSVAFGNGTLVTTSSIATIANVTATTVNFAGAATTLTMGATSGTGSIRNASVTLPNATLINLSSTSAVTIGHVGASGQNLTISSSNGNVLVEGTIFSVNNVSVPGILEVTGSATGSIARFQQLSGSLTKLQDGTTNYLEAGSGISITTGSNGQVTITGGAGANFVTSSDLPAASPFTVTIPTQCNFIGIEICGGGGGGGAGGKHVNGNGSCGGGGGSGGNYSSIVFDASTIRSISSTLTVTLGAGGNGAGANSGAATATGGNGNNGIASTVAAGATTILFAPGGAGGTGGGQTTGNGGKSTSWKDVGGDGANGSITAKPSAPLAAGFGGGGGGGGGLSASVTPVERDGGNGGLGGDVRIDNLSRAGAGGTAAGIRNGANATASATFKPTGGGGGGGGAARNGTLSSGPAGNGGAGVQGGGGGGGGGNVDTAGNDGGAGGKGGDGWCIIRFF